MNRQIVWFSCGSASAVAAKLALMHYQNTVVVYCDMFRDENEDNKRFFGDVQEWLGVPIEVISNPKFQSIEEVLSSSQTTSMFSVSRLMRLPELNASSKTTQNCGSTGFSRTTA